jgi:DNA-binding transcriptional LysR family regulator
MVLAGHAERLLEEVARAEADLAAVAGTVSGRGRIASFQSGSLRIAIPAMSALMSEHPDLRCELVTAEPEQSLLALSVGDVDLVIGDEWQHAPWRMPDGLDRVELLRDPVVLTLPASDPLLAGRKRGAVRIEQLSQRPWISGPAGLGWDEITERICRERGGFAPQIRHRSNDAVIATRLVAHGLGVALLPMLALSEDQRIAIRTVADERPIRRIHAVTRAADSRQPSIQAMLDAVKDAAASLRR